MANPRPAGRALRLAALAVLALLACPLAPVAAAPASPFAYTVVFGDSFTDYGNMYAFRGQPGPPWFVEGRDSNGPTWCVSFVPSLFHILTLLIFIVGNYYTRIWGYGSSLWTFGFWRRDTTLNRH